MWHVRLFTHRRCEGHEEKEVKPEGPRPYRRRAESEMGDCKKSKDSGQRANHVETVREEGLGEARRTQGPGQGDAEAGGYQGGGCGSPGDAFAEHTERRYAVRRAGAVCRFSSAGVVASTMPGVIGEWSRPQFLGGKRALAWTYLLLFVETI